VGIFKGKKKILAAAADIAAARVWSIDCFEQWIGNRAVYLYTILVS
jgi:hypothetical protein